MAKQSPGNRHTGPVARCDRSNRSQQKLAAIPDREVAAALAGSARPITAGLIVAPEPPPVPPPVVTQTATPGGRERGRLACRSDRGRHGAPARGVSGRGRSTIRDRASPSRWRPAPGLAPLHPRLSGQSIDHDANPIYLPRMLEDTTVRPAPPAGLRHWRYARRPCARQRRAIRSDGAAVRALPGTAPRGAGREARPPGLRRRGVR
jgi:hypothetical protein